MMNFVRIDSKQIGVITLHSYMYRQGEASCGCTLFSVLEECLIQELQRFDAFLGVDYGNIPVFLRKENTVISLFFIVEIFLDGSR